MFCRRTAAEPGRRLCARVREGTEILAGTTQHFTARHRTTQHSMSLVGLIELCPQLYPFDVIYRHVDFHIRCSLSLIRCCYIRLASELCIHVVSVGRPALVFTMPYICVISPPPPSPHATPHSKCFEVSHPFRNPHSRRLVPLLVSPVAYFELVVLSSLKVRLTSAGKASGSAKASSKVPAVWR